MTFSVFLKRPSNSPFYFPDTTAQNGNALLYILVAIALLGALTATMIEPSSNQSKAQNAHKIVTELESQLNFIRSAIQECVMAYPAGDPTIVNGTGVNNNYTAPYPLTPTETHFIGSTLGITLSLAASGARCPGNPGVDKNHTPLFGGSSGRFFPPTPSLFDEWLYFNGLAPSYFGASYEGVVLFINTTNTDPQIATALTSLVAKYTDCEADYILGDGTNGCEDGKQCFFYWIIRKSAC